MSAEDFKNILNQNDLTPFNLTQNSLGPKFAFIPDWRWLAKLQAVNPEYSIISSKISIYCGDLKNR